jgi:hypothetical protein
MSLTWGWTASQGDAWGRIRMELEESAEIMREALGKRGGIGWIGDLGADVGEDLGADAGAEARDEG